MIAGGTHSCKSLTDFLHRAVIAGKDTKYNSVSDLRGEVLGVSRMGSGSQIFASYMALREKWFADEAKETVEKLDFAGGQARDCYISYETDTQLLASPRHVQSKQSL